MHYRFCFKTLVSLAGALLYFGAATNAHAIDWDGGAATNDWDTATNWAGDVAPTASDNAVFDVSTGLPSFGGVDVGTASVAADVTVDIAAWALRADATGTAVKDLTLDNLTFTSNFTNNAGAGTTFTNGGNSDGLRLIFTQGNRSITNNSADTVVFDSGTDTRGFGISGVGDPVNVLLEGTGDFTWDRGRIFGTIDRFGTGDTFTGTFTVNTGHPTAAAFNMAVDLRAQGGTIDVNASNTIGDAVNITLNDSVGPVDATIDLSGVTDNVGSLNSFNNGGILACNGSTDILFADYNEAPVTITGFVTGRTELKFDGAAGTESLANLSINAGTAAWLDLGGGTFALVPSATVSDPLILISGEEALSNFTTVTRGTASASQTISVEGVNLTDDITVTAPSTSFEVSLDDITFSSDVTLTQSGGTVGATTVHIRLAAVAQGGDYSQNLLLESTGAVNRVVELSASVPALTDPTPITWDGDASALWATPANWNPDSLPGSVDDVLIDSSTSLPAFGGISVDSDALGVAEFGSLTVDLAAFAFRSGGDSTADNIDAYGDITFTGTFTNNGGAGTTFRDGASGGFLRLRSAVSTLNIVNNGTNPVVYDGSAVNAFGISSTGSGGAFVLLSGSGGHVWNDGIVFGGVQRFGLSDGTLSINGGSFAMGIDLRAEGGTIEVNADNLIGDTTNVTLNDSVGPVDATIDLSGVTDNVGSLNTFNNGGTLAVSGSTDILFADYNEGPVAITGFVTGRTELKFDAVAGTESLASLTINGGAAAWLDLGGGTFALVPSATVSDPLILISDEEALSNFTTGTRGTASASQAISVEGVNLTDDITVTAPSTSFEVSLDNITFSSDVTLTQSGGTVGATTVHIRLAAVAQGGDYSQNLLLESTGAVNRVVELSASVPALTDPTPITWDGDASALWATPANWNPDSLPGSVDDVLIDSSTSLPAFGGISVDSDALGVAEFGSLTVDLAAFAFRSGGDSTADNIDAYGDITFTGTFTNNGGAGTTFRDGASGGFLRLRSAVGTLSIVNNGTNPVVYGGSATNAFGISSTGSGGGFVLLSGAGGHVWDDGTVFGSVDRFGLSDGSLTINGGSFAMGTDLRAEGGTITINASDIIDDSANVTLNDNAGPVDATIDFSGQTETANVLNTFNAGGNLAVDGSTALTFTTLNNSSGTVDITGWSEGSSSIVFSTLGAPYNDTVADGQAFVGLTIGGGTAYMIDIGGGAYEVSNSPTTSAYASWASGEGLDGSPGAEAGFTDNPDNDTFVNGLDWILGGDPLAFESFDDLVTTTGDGTTGLTLTFSREDDSEAEVTLEVEYGGDLTAFPTASVVIGAASSGPDGNGVTVTVTENAASPDTVSVNIPASNAVDDKLFGRLKATQL